ncbi:hypothetical protein PI125_g9606 [Phytophthora idaei]|nr:hypothetical protein PI125_g9606 [Phytophthora idaei]KAG3161746.1 hypothetical protein PI126_g6298 [Phytophthora idaei]
MVKDKTTAYKIFQTLCSKYEGAAIHGDPYYIQSYLMALKYEEGADLMSFIIDLEESMKTAAEATNSVLSDEQKSLYLYHSLPTEWKLELAVWKGSREFTPYEDLKRHIETKVQNEQARNRYVLRQGTPESKETRAERLSSPMPAALQASAKTEIAAVLTLKCTYCHRSNHDTVDYYILQRHLRDGQVKAGTVLLPTLSLRSHKVRNVSTHTRAATLITVEITRSQTTMAEETTTGTRMGNAKIVTGIAELSPH